jgi:Uma2 family endonuclease
MSVTLAPPSPLETVADLLEHLGDIPPDRICIQPPLGTATESDVLVALESPRKRICELIDGVLVEKAMGYEESALAIYLSALLHAFVRSRNLGLVTGPDGTIRLWPGRVRIPDIAFYSWDRFPDRRMPKAPIPLVAPDLAIEVLSVGNTPKEMLLKRQDYFAAGGCLVWEINPRERTVGVYSSAEAPSAVLTEADVLDGSPALPGFTLALRNLFAELDRHG